MRATNFDELQKKQDELRKQRNKLTDEYYKQNNALQKQIDELDLQKYNADKFLNKYVCINYRHSIVYMFVCSMERLFKGPRYKGYGFIVNKRESDDYEDYSVISIYDNLEETVEHNELDYIVEITKDEYYNKLTDAISDIAHMNILKTEY